MKTNSPMTFITFKDTDNKEHTINAERIIDIMAGVSSARIYMDGLGMTTFPQTSRYPTTSITSQEPNHIEIDIGTYQVIKAVLESKTAQ